MFWRSLTQSTIKVSLTHTCRRLGYISNILLVSRRSRDLSQFKLKGCDQKGIVQCLSKRSILPVSSDPGSPRAGHPVIPRLVELSYLGTAQEIVPEGRCRVRAEQAAFGRFARHVAAIEPSSPARTRTTGGLYSWSTPVRTDLRMFDRRRGHGDGG